MFIFNIFSGVFIIYLIGNKIDNVLNKFGCGPLVNANYSYNHHSFLHFSHSSFTQK